MLHWAGRFQKERGWIECLKGFLADDWKVMFLIEQHHLVTDRQLVFPFEHMRGSGSGIKYQMIEVWLGLVLSCSCVVISHNEVNFGANFLLTNALAFMPSTTQSTFWQKMTWILACHLSRLQLFAFWPKPSEILFGAWQTLDGTHCMVNYTLD